MKGVFRGGDRFARHWYDLDCLDRIGIAQSAFDDRGLAADVARHKQIFFRENDASGNPIDYHDAVTGSLCLIPTGDALDGLKQDYLKMFEAGLLERDAIAFDELIARLSGLQDRENTIG